MSGYRRICVVVCLVLLTAVSALANAMVFVAAADYGGKRHDFSMPSFTEIGTVANSDQYSSVAMGDVDGYAEILSGAGKYMGGGIPQGLYLWQYSGSSWSRQTIKSTGYYGCVALADITGDGVPDAIAAGESHWSGGTVSGLVLYQFSHTGTAIDFSAMASPYTSTSADCVAAGDIEGDGDSDIVLGTHGDDIKVFINQGAGASWDTITLSATDETTGVALGDLNGDGWKDIVATNYNNANSRVYLCTAVNPHVTFSDANETGLDTSIGYGIGIADFDSDGHADLAIGTGGGVKVYFGNGCSGDVSTWWSGGTNYPVGANRRMQVAVGDIDKDGKKDIAVATGYTGSGIGVLHNDGSRSFSSQTPSGIPTSGDYYGCCLFDWDKDGDLDMAICGWGTGVHFYRNDFLTAPEFGGNFATVVSMASGCAMMAAVVGLLRRKRNE